MKRLSRNNVPVVAGLVLFVVAINVPFLNQAFHMDDAIYLLLAKSIQRSFWFPQDMQTNFEGTFVGDIASTEHAWPLTSFLLAFSAYIGRGFSEVAMHLGFLVFPITLTIAMYYLASRFTKHPMYATLIFLTMPVVCVLSHTLMTDIPLLALWTTSVTLFCRGVDGAKRSCTWLGALTAGVSSLVSYSGLCLIPLLALYAILRKNRGALPMILIVPVSILGFVLAVNLHHYHRFTPSMLLGYYFVAKRVLSPALLIEKSIFVVLTIGAVTVFPVTLLSQSRKKLIGVALIVGISLAILSEVSKYKPLPMALFVVLFCAGFPQIIEIAGTAARSFRYKYCEAAEDIFLGAWFVGVGVFCIAAYMNGSARYLLPATPPLVLILVRRMERSMRESILRRMAIATAILGGLFGALLAVSDSQFAEIYREFASTLKRTHLAPGTRLWFTGEWGFRAYLEQAGGRELGRRDASPKLHDLLIVPNLATPYQTLFSDRLSLESIVMVAPCRIKFDISSLSRNSVLVCTTGMPFYDKSDGIDFSVRFASPEGEQVLSRERIPPSVGMQWQAHEIPLAAGSGSPGSIIFTVEVGNSGNADADWLAISRARICRRDGPGEMLLYDFREHLKGAQIEPLPDEQYHTNGNIPVFPMTVWLKQEPTVALRGRYEYQPASPLRLLDRQCHAGFWSSGWGWLPFSIAGRGSILESISVYEIIREVDGYGESTPSWY